MRPLPSLMATIVFGRTRYTNECWNDEFVPELCCEPHDGGNPQCWDDAGHYTYDKCCRKCWSDPLYRPLRCCEGGLATEGDPRCWFDGRNYFDCCAPDTPGLAAIRRREAGTGGWHWDGDFAWSGDLSFSQGQVSQKYPELWRISVALESTAKACTVGE